MGAMWLLKQISESYARGERKDWLISAPTAKVLGQATLVKFNEYIPSDWAEYKEQKQEYQLAWGNKIFVRSGDEPDHIEGMTIGGGWFDEPGQMHHQMWINIQSRLAISRGSLVMTSTPYDMNWYCTDVEQRACQLNGKNLCGCDHDKPSPDCKFDHEIAMFRWRSKDNKFFPVQEYERAKKMMTPEMFARRYDGEFTRLEGLVYKDFRSSDHIVKPFPIPGEWKRFAGLDFGNDHPTAVVCVAQKPAVPGNKDTGIPDEPSKFYVFAEYYHRKRGLSELAQFLNAQRFGYILADPRGATERDELSRAYGVRGVQIADNSIQVGIERISQLLRENRLFFFEGRCPNVIDEITSYHHQPLNSVGASRDMPVKVHDDAMDALRYAFSRIPEGLYPGKHISITKIRAVAHARANGNFSSDLPASPTTGYI